MNNGGVIKCAEAGVIEGYELITLAENIKTFMIKKGIDRAQKTCPRCGEKGALKARLVGAGQHIRINCITPECGVTIME